jgi:hypothetical protein
MVSTIFFFYLAISLRSIITSVFIGLIRRRDMSENVICPRCKASVVANGNFCPNCGKPVSAAGRKRAEDGLVNLVQGMTSLVQGTGKLVSALGEVVENRAAEGMVSKDVDNVLASLGKAVKDVGESVDRLSKEAADKAEKQIRKRK